MNTFLNNFDKFFVGIDDLMDRVDNYVQHGYVHSNYPPYNTIKNEDGYTIELAVAGFTEDDLDIEIKDKTLVIKGDHKSEDSRKFVFRGLAGRSFTKQFLLNDTINKESVTAKLNNGVLTISLKTLAKDNDSIKVSINGDKND